MRLKALNASAVSVKARCSLRRKPFFLAFSDGATEARSPAGEQLTHGGLLALAEETLRGMRESESLAEFSQRLLGGVQAHRGGAELEDDVTLLTLRRVS